MIVIMTKATALNLRITLHSNFGLGVATITMGICSALLSKLSEVDAENASADELAYVRFGS